MESDGTATGTAEAVGVEALHLVEGDGGRRVRLVPGLPVAEKDRILRRTRRMTEVGHRVAAFYLWELEERGEAKLLGYPSAVDYAARRLDLPRRTARDLVDTGRLLAGLGKVDAAFAAGELSWSRVRLLSRIATAETEDAWLGLARTAPWEAFELETKLAKRGEPPRRNRKGLPELRLKLPLRLDPLAHELWQQAKKKLGAERGAAVGDAEALRTFAKLFLSTAPDGQSEGRIPEATSPFRVSVNWCPDCHAPTVATEDGPVPIDAGTAAPLLAEATITTVRDSPAAPAPSFAGDLDRTTPSWMRDEVLARDGFRCTHCRSRDGLMVHHVVWRSRGGATEPQNLTTCCTTCHVLIHAGCLNVHGDAPHALSWISAGGEATNRPISTADGLQLKLPEGEPGASPALAAAFETVTLESLPAQLDPEDLSGLVPFLSWNERRGVFALEAHDRPIDRAAVPPSKPGSATTTVHPPGHRPAGLADVIGQRRAVATLTEAVQAATRSGEAVAHTLLLGGPGLGKSSLMRALAADLGTVAHLSSGPHLRDLGVLLQLLLRLRPRDVLGIDEIHALPPRVAEALYEAMEDGMLTLPVTDGTRVRTLALRLPPFTLVAATTETATLPKPLVMRFPIRELLEWYETDDLARIVGRAAVRSGTTLAADAARVIARAGRDTPREALALFIRVRNAALASGSSSIDAPFASATLAAHGIDPEGLDALDRRILALLSARRNPLGLDRLAALLGTTPRILQEVHEPFLVRRGLLLVTPHGRTAGRQSSGVPPLAVITGPGRDQPASG